MAWGMNLTDRQKQLLEEAAKLPVRVAPAGEREKTDELWSLYVDICAATGRRASAKCSVAKAEGMIEGFGGMGIGGDPELTRRAREYVSRHLPRPPRVDGLPG